MKASQIVAALVALYADPRYAAFPELRLGNLGQPGGQESQRCDLWVIDTWPSSHYARDAYEVKCSRRDYAAEVRNPQKRMLAMLLSNRFTFAVPTGLVRADEVPPDCGLVYVSEGGEDGRTMSVREVRPAPWREVPPPTARFLAELARRAADPTLAEFRGLVAATARARDELRRVHTAKQFAEREAEGLRAEVERLRAERAALRASSD